MVQLRVKHATDREVLVWGRAIRELTREAGVRFVLNDRFDLALACEADAVHLGQTDLPPQALPAVARVQLAVGRSTHDLEQARAARTEAVDYVAFGPVFGTTSKTSEWVARGTDALAQIVALAAPEIGRLLRLFGFSYLPVTTVAMFVGVGLLAERRRQI